MNKIYVIADKCGDITLYYCGLNGWSKLPENAIHYSSEQEAKEQIVALDDKSLDVERF